MHLVKIGLNRTLYIDIFWLVMLVPPADQELEVTM